MGFGFVSFLASVMDLARLVSMFSMLARQN
jgi:hypothetical protein